MDIKIVLYRLLDLGIQVKKKPPTQRAPLRAEPGFASRRPVPLPGKKAIQVPFKNVHLKAQCTDRRAPGASARGGPAPRQKGHGRSHGWTDGQTDRLTGRGSRSCLPHAGDKRAQRLLAAAPSTEREPDTPPGPAAGRSLTRLQKHLKSTHLKNTHLLQANCKMHSQRERADS